MKLGTLLLLSLLPLGLFSQTGPGGVGSSSINVLWLDAGKGVVTLGSEVTTWADQSGNLNNALPPLLGLTQRPKLVSSGVNGQAVISFDGVDDELRILENSTLDLNQWHIFLVTKVTTQKNYNAWITKGNDGQENYELLSYNDGNIHAPIYFTNNTRTFPNASAGIVTTSHFDIIEYSFESSNGRRIYKNGGLDYSDSDNKVPQSNNLDVYIGNEKGTSRNLSGEIAEIIIYNDVLNSAQRIIVNNYLAAKYNRTLTGIDYYTGDNNGFDFDVAGIGRGSGGSNTQTNSKGTGTVRISGASGLGNNEYLIWGHNNGNPWASNSTDVPSSVASRFERSWKFSERGDVGTVDMEFDLSGLGGITASHLRLLVDANNNGSLADDAPISGAVHVIGAVYSFSNVSISDNMIFSIGTINPVLTPLPVELTHFTASLQNEKVYLNWATTTERNNDYFAVERSRDGINFAEIAKVDGGGNQNQINTYASEDEAPLEGTSYYRLKQTDVDGKSMYSELQKIEFTKHATFEIFPNPSQGDELKVYLSGLKNSEVLVVVYDANGNESFSKIIVTEEAGDHIYAIDPAQKLSPGFYIITATSQQTTFSKKLLVK